MFLQVYFFHVNLFISRIGTLCTFFTVRTVRINRSVTRLAKHLCLYVYFYVCLFLRRRLLFTFLAVTMFRSVTAYTCTRCFFMSIFHVYLLNTRWYLLYHFSRSGYFVPLYQKQKIYGFFMSTFTSVYFFHGLLSCLPFSRYECFVL